MMVKLIDATNGATFNLTGCKLEVATLPHHLNFVLGMMK